MKIEINERGTLSVFTDNDDEEIASFRSADECEHWLRQDAANLQTEAQKRLDLIPQLRLAVAS